MKLGVMFRDAAESLFRKPNTRLYPFERTEAPEKYRGRLIWNQSTCTGCGLCVMDCPALAIEMNALDKKAKRFVFTYHAERCTFCAQCVYSCRQGSLSLSSTDWEMAALSQEPFTTYSGAEADVALVRSGSQS
jgi:formate hydrogenlyase subunit 6/NADH:ubiquinone oxidoreductase subunit I